MNNNTHDANGLPPIRNPQLAFASGKEQGLDADAHMYMYSTDARDYFKNIITRDYVSYPIVSS